MEKEEIYGPEGYYNNPRNDEGYPLDYVMAAIREGNILESVVTKLSQDSKLTLNISDKIIGEIEADEFEVYDGGGKTGYMFAKVGLAVKYVPLSVEEKDGVHVVKCSRKKAQEQCLENYVKQLKSGDIIRVSLLNIYRNSIFCDIGCGIAAILPFSLYCVPKIKNITKELIGTKHLRAAVSHFDEQGRITLTHKELLGTWKESLEGIHEGEIVTGYVNNVDNHGVWVLLGVNVVALAEHGLPVSVGDKVTVYVKQICPEAMKIKIVIKSIVENNSVGYLKPTYRIKYGPINYWKYSPEECKTKNIETRFNNEG